MRPVTIFAWKHINGPRSGLVKKEDGKGVFYGFGVNSESSDYGAAPYSTAIVERSDGQLLNLPLDLVRFDDVEPSAEQEQAIDNQIKPAMDVLRRAMKEDPDYAHCWHCNIAMACSDAMPEADDEDEYENRHATANETASRFMKLCFDVETTAEPPTEQEEE